MEDKKIIWVLVTIAAIVILAYVSLSKIDYSPANNFFSSEEASNESDDIDAMIKELENDSSLIDSAINEEPVNLEE